MNLESVSMVVEIVYRAVAAAGIIVGGVWVWRLYVKERLHAERINLTIKPDVVLDGGVLRVIADCSVSNVGARQVRLNDAASAVVLRAKIASPEGGYTADETGSSTSSSAFGRRWREVGRDTVLEGLDVIEPAETMEDTAEIEVRAALAGSGSLLLEAYVYSEKADQRWRARKLVKNLPRKDN